MFVCDGLVFIYFFNVLFIFERENEQGKGKERGREDRKQALH